MINKRIMNKKQQHQASAHASSQTPHTKKQKHGTKKQATEASAELEEVKQQCDEYLRGWQRARADYENLQRETATKISNNIKYANEELLINLLPMVDHFKYAFKGIPEAEKESNWLKGIEYIQSNFIKILEENGVEMMKTVGETFDSEIHEAIEEIEPTDDTQKSGIIAEEVASGFLLNGKVIQHAKVKVYK